MGSVVRVKFIKRVVYSDESDLSESREEWKSEENISNIIPFTEQPSIKTLILRLLESNPTSL